MAKTRMNEPATAQLASITMRNRMRRSEAASWICGMTASGATESTRFTSRLPRTVWSIASVSTTAANPSTSASTMPAAAISGRVGFAGSDGYRRRGDDPNLVAATARDRR